MKTQILDEAESAQALKEFFENQAVNPYDYILVTSVTDDIDFQNELFQMFEHLRKWKTEEYSTFTYTFYENSEKVNEVRIYFYEKDNDYSVKFDNYFDNIVHLEHYIKYSLIENWEG